VIPTPRNTNAIMPNLTTIHAIHYSLETFVHNKQRKQIMVGTTAAQLIENPLLMVNATFFAPST
jgi:hypothetical protein